MDIRSKLLAFFIPLIVIPIAATGYLAVYNSQSMLRESEKLSESIGRLQLSAAHAENKLTSVIESKTLFDYRFFSRHLRQNIELQISDLEKIMAALAGSELTESYIKDQPDAPSAQLKSLLESIIRNYTLSEISMLTPEGRELLRIVSEENRNPLENAADRIPDKSGTEWFRNRLSDKETFAHITVCLENKAYPDAFEPALSLTCPLLRSSKKISFSHGSAPGYLRLAVRISDLVGFVIQPDADFHGKIIITDADEMILAHTDTDKVGTRFDAFSPELSDYHIVSHNMLEKLLHLHILIEREKISESSSIVRSLAGAVHERTVEARKTSSEIRKRINDILQQIVFITLFALMTAVGVVVFVSSKISDPITRLSDTAIRIAAGELEVEPLAEKTASSEIVLLAKNFNTMRLNLKNQIENLDRLVEERTRELNEANAALRESLEELNRTQDQLIQSGKMAALGNLVAGVAHEINTPVGIGVTAASLLEEKSREMAESYAAGQLKRSALEKYIRTATETSASILSNLDRASEMIQSFKQVAVDQTVEEKRRFRIRRYIDEVLLSLRPGYKRTRHTISVNCPDEISFYSYPGAFMQIITNLVMNSLIHGFEGIEQGNIFIDVFTENHMLHFRYSDNGKGMKAEQAGRIFEPFFTTRRARGGTGLGMHIVYNLVTQTLGGQIECSSAPGKGTVFDITIQLEEKNHAADGS
jgi:signal transduction histidine kinase